MKLAFVLLAGTATAMANAVHQPGKRIHHGVADHFKGKREETELEKRDTYSGTATWYDVTTGAGACGDYMSPSDFVVALNTPQLQAYGGYVNGKPSTCYDSITISYNGETQVATIKDECPTCAWGSLDMSEGLFSSFASLDAGVFQMTWWFNDGSNSGGSNNNNNTPTSTSTPAWTPDPTPTPTPTPTSTYVPPPAQTTSSVYTPPPPESSSSDPPSSSSTTTTTTTPSNNIGLMNHAVVQFAGMINVAAAAGN